MSQVPVNIRVIDPEARLGNSLPLLNPTIQAALNYLDQFLRLRGTIDVDIRVESTTTGRFSASGDVAFAGTRNNVPTWEAALVAESRTGIDPNPSVADLTIYIDPGSSYLAGLWWDPAIATSLAANPPNDRTDAFSVVLHEILHGMGVTGWRNIQTGALLGNGQSVWDSMIRLSGGLAYFDGPATVALLGEGAEVRLGGSQGGYHLGAGPAVAASRQPWLEASSLNGYYFVLGERYTLGRLELAMLQDIGWTLDAGLTMTDVVNRWEDRPGAFYAIGWDGGDTLAGSSLDDRLEGRNGDDSLAGGAGNDFLFGGDGKDQFRGGLGDDQVIGGAGLDIAHFGYPSVAAEFTILPSSLKVRGSEGTDTLMGVERLWFSDRKLAFDLGSHDPAGQAALALGVLLPSGLASPAIVGVVLGLIDSGMDIRGLCDWLDREGWLGYLAGSKSAEAIARMAAANVLRIDPPAPLVDLLAGFMDGRTAAYTPAEFLGAVALLDVNQSAVDLVGLQQRGLFFE